LELGLFAYAEFAEDEVEDVVGCGGAGEGIEGAKGVVEVQENHFVGDFVDGCLSGLGERGERRGDCLLLADIGEQGGFCGGGGVGDLREDGGA
jgi:hypothetical protein